MSVRGPANDPRSFERPPALSTRASQSELYEPPVFHSPTTTAPPLSLPSPIPVPSQPPSTLQSTSTMASPPEVQPQAGQPQVQSTPIYDSFLAPHVFRGLATEDAESWFADFQKYVSFRNMSLAQMLSFFPLLLKDTAGDWYDMLSQEVKSDWQQLQGRFKDRFQDSDLLKWQKASKMWARDQLVGESVEEFVTALQKMAKTAGVDDTMLRYSVMRGLRRELRPHVIQSGATTLADVVKAAKVAEVATGDQLSSAPDPLLGKMLDEVSAGRRVAEQNAVDIQRLAAKLASSTVSTVERATSSPGRSSTSQRQVSFRDEYDTRRRATTWNPRPPSPPTRGQSRPAQRWTSRGRTAATTTRIQCTKCGGMHALDNRYCRAFGVRCFNCHGMNHLSRCCRRGRRTFSSPNQA